MPEVRARAFARRAGAARGAARDAGGGGPKKTSGPTDRACSHLEIFPTPARGIRVARDPNDAETPAGPHAEPKTDPSVPSIAKQSDQPTIGGGYNLLKRIRRVYAHDERPYHAFLAILIRFRNAEFTTEQVRAPALVSPPKTSETAPIEPPGCFLDRRRDPGGCIGRARPVAPTLPRDPASRPLVENSKKNHLERGAGQMGTASQHQQISDREKSPSVLRSVVFPRVSSTSSDGATSPRSPTRRVPSPTPTHFPAQVIKNVATLFYDQPDLLHGKDGLEFFVPKTCKPPQPSQWFQWTVKTHNRFGRVSFRVAVRMLLL